MRPSFLMFISLLLILSIKIMGQYQRIDIPTKQILRDVYFFDENRGIVIADSGLILRTYDGGQSWQKEYMNPINDDFHRLLFPEDSTGYLFGRDGNIWKTTDLGSAWTWISQVDTIGFYTFDAQFVTPDIGYAANYFNIYRTDDGGYSWNPLNFPAVFVSYLYFSTPDSGKATSANGIAVFTTSDGGVSWAEDSLEKKHNEYWFSTKLFLTGKGGFLFCSGGHPTSFCDVYQFDSQSSIWRVNYNFPYLLGEVHDVSFPNDSVGYAVGGIGYSNGRKILKTQDFGASWSLQSLSGDEIGISGVHFVDENVGYLAGGNFFSQNKSAFFKTINGGGPITSIKKDHYKPPFSYSLRNYPNPFNPETTIEFYLPHHAEVRLKIFNVLGQRIRTLFTGRRDAGVYRLKWNGRDEAGNEVASGVYIYRLQADRFVQSRKMLLLR